MSRKPDISLHERQRSAIASDAPQNAATKPQSDITASHGNARYQPKNIPIESIIELVEKKLTHSEIGKILNCDKSNISKRLAQIGYDSGRLQHFKSRRADVLAFHQSRILNKFIDAEDKIEIETARDLKDAAVAFSVLYDKERLETGKSTQNIETHHTLVEQFWAGQLKSQVGDDSKNTVDNDSKSCLTLGHDNKLSGKGDNSE